MDSEPGFGTNLKASSQEFQQLLPEEGTAHPAWPEPATAAEGTTAVDRVGDRHGPAAGLSRRAMMQERGPTGPNPAHLVPPAAPAPLPGPHRMEWRHGSS
jgi:hypothetical protein